MKGLKPTEGVEGRGCGENAGGGGVIDNLCCRLAFTGDSTGDASVSDDLVFVTLKQH